MTRQTKFKICMFYDNSSVTMAIPELFDTKDLALDFMDNSENDRMKYLRRTAEFVIMPVYKYV